MKPLISVIVPVYQVEDYIADTINSIVNQTYTPFEIILVNDGTKDKSVEIALNILNKTTTNYTLIEQVNMGLAAARNTGFRKSKGDWTVCVDSDDIIAPEFLERLYSTGIKYNSDVVSCNFQYVYSKNVFKKNDIWGKDHIISRDDILMRFLKRSINIIAPGLLISKAFLEKNDLWYDESVKFSEDQHFIWRVLLNATKVAIVEDRLYNYLMRNNSITTSSDSKVILTGFAGIKRLENEINDTGAIKKYLLPRWILGTLHDSAKSMDLNNFYDIALKLDYKRNFTRLLSFPDFRVRILSLLILINCKLFYRIGKLI
jgi:glycosyltransferase involved in cell wall biosynthesis